MPSAVRNASRGATRLRIGRVAQLVVARCSNHRCWEFESPLGHPGVLRLDAALHQSGTSAAKLIERCRDEGRSNVICHDEIVAQMEAVCRDQWRAVSSHRTPNDASERGSTGSDKPRPSGATPGLAILQRMKTTAGYANGKAARLRIWCLWVRLPLRPLCLKRSHAR